jgi:hypothetical protein
MGDLTTDAQIRKEDSQSISSKWFRENVPNLLIEITLTQENLAGSA